MDPATQAKLIHKQFDSDKEIAVTSIRKSKTPPERLSAELRSILENGYVVIPDLLTDAELKEIKDATMQIIAEEQRAGRNAFEGRNTSRPYAILGKSRVYDRLAEHPVVMRLADELLLPNYLITASQAIYIHPGEAPQPLHYDDTFCEVPRPRQHFGIATMWAITDFTAENGATVLFPKSHLWGDRLPSRKNDVSVPAAMKAGSVCVFLSTLWHGGGANTSNSSRLGITFQYCEPYIRPQENQFLAVPFSVAKTLSPKIQSMLGYSIHPPFIGHANGHHPLRALAKL